MSITLCPAGLQQGQTLEECPLDSAQQTWLCQALRLGLHQTPNVLTSGRCKHHLGTLCNRCCRGQASGSRP